MIRVARIFPSRFKYPLFFTGLLIMEMAGILFKVAHLSEVGVEGMVLIGFITFVFSIVAS